MATSKTGSFYLTETVSLAALAPSANRVQATVDMGAYVNVPTGQAIAIDQVDFIYQDSNNNNSCPSLLCVGNGTLTAQLTDLNPNTAFVRADDQSLIASGALAIDDSNNIGTHVSDLYPDDWGTISEAFMVVNDTLYLVGGYDSAVGGSTAGATGVYITARIRCRVVKLSQKDWMAIAIQSTASDN